MPDYEDIEALFDEYEPVGFPPARSSEPFAACFACGPLPCFAGCPGLA